MGRNTLCPHCGADLTRQGSVERLYPYLGHYYEDDFFEEESGSENYFDTCVACERRI